MAVKTFITGEKLTTSDTNAFLNNGGLVYVTQTAFTSSAQTDITNCFSSTYDNYRIELEWLQNTSTGTTQIWLRDSGGAIASNYGYTAGGYYASSGTLTWAGFNVSANETQTSGWVMGVVSGYRGFAWFDVFGPNLSRETNLIGQVGTSNSSATLTRVYVSSNIRHNAATQCTGITIYPSAGSITGTIRIYGYRQA